MRPQSVLTGFQALGQTVQRLPSTQGLPRGICCHAPGKCDRNVQSYFQEIFIKLQHKAQAYEAGHKTHKIIWQVARDHPLYICTFCDPPTMSADFFCKTILNLQKKNQALWCSVQQSELSPARPGYKSHQFQLMFTFLS